MLTLSVLFLTLLVVHSSPFHSDGSRIENIASLGATLRTLNLSGNAIERIEGLDALCVLRELNLASNRVRTCHWLAIQV